MGRAQRQPGGRCLRLLDGGLPGPAASSSRRAESRVDPRSSTSQRGDRMTFDLDDANLDRLLADAAPPTREFAPPRSVREAIVTSNVTRTRRRLRARWVLAPSAAAVALSALLLAAGPQRDGSIQTANAAATVLDRAAEA